MAFYLSHDRKVIVAINLHDHLMITVQSNTSDLHEVYGRLTRIMVQMDCLLEFQQHSRLGYRTFSPLDLGITLQINVQIRLLYYDDRDRESLTILVSNLDIDVDDTPEIMIYNLSNSTWLGRTEFHIIRGMRDAIQKILDNDLK